MLIILTGVLAVLLYFTAIKPRKYWKKKGVSDIKPWPIFGNMASVIFRRCAIGDLVNDMYKAFPKKKYLGIYQFLEPTLIIRDPDLIREITVTEFDTFPDHQTFTSHLDPLWSRNLFSLNSIDGWYDMRNTLSPLFTNSNMGRIFPSMKKCAEQFTLHYFEKEGDTILVELKDAFTRFTNDVIATTVFGITCNSLKDRKNEFYVMGKNASNFSGLRGLKFFGYTISPTLMKVNLFSQEVSNYFRRIIKVILKTREEEQNSGLDMFDLLMEAKKKLSEGENHNKFAYSDFPMVQELETEYKQENQNLELNEDDITAQVLLFFVGGFETASTFMCYTAYELALSPKVQDKLRKEIQASFEICKESTTYETVLSMKYLDNIISEALRKWPPAVFADRKYVKPFTIEPKEPGEKLLYLEPGTVCWIPIYPLHRNPDYYPDPERFDPDRFNDENKHNIKPFTYLPFGSGPRNCIAYQFALLECKAMIVELVRKFHIVSINRTAIPLKMNRKSFHPLQEEGIWVGLRKIHF